MKHFLTGVLFIYCAALNAENGSTPFPANFNAVFGLYKNGFMVAETKYSLLRQQNELTFTANTTLSGFASLFDDSAITETSRFDTSSADVVKLASYQFEQTSDEKKSINSIINWQQHNITTRINQQAAIITSSFTPPIWDKHSVFLALMTQAHNSKGALLFNALDEGIIKQYRFTFIGTKEIELGIDEWKKTVLWQTESGYKTIIFYLDPNNHYVPLKIEQYKKRKLRVTLWLKELIWHE